jgi:hypothetical protein
VADSESYTIDGGPAFPLPVMETRDGAFETTNVTGMSLRDYIATQALAGWLSSYGENCGHPCANGSADVVAAQAYELADAMLKARAPLPDAERSRPHE